jgi:hypothetical protein
MGLQQCGVLYGGAGRVGGMSAHLLKILPEYYDAMVSGAKNFECRRDDRGFKVGDILHLHRFDPVAEDLNETGLSAEYVERVITYKLDGGQWGIDDGWCVLALGVIE